MVEKLSGTPAVSFNTDNPTYINMACGNLAQQKIQHKKKVERLAANMVLLF